MEEQHLKKAIKRIIIALGVVLGLSLPFVGGVYASQFIKWDGTEDYNSTIATIEKIITRGQSLKSERDTAINAKKQLDNEVKEKEKEIKDKEKEIKDKEDDIEALEKEIEKLEKKDNSAELEKRNKELEQAIKDMKDVDQKAKEALENLK